MGIIVGISRGISLARRAEKRYRYLDPTNKFIRKFVPPRYRTRTRQIKDILVTGGLLYDPIVETYRGFQKKVYQSRQNRQARDYMVRPRSGLRYGNRRKDPCFRGRRWS